MRLLPVAALVLLVACSGSSTGTGSTGGGSSASSSSSSSSSGGGLFDSGGGSDGGGGGSSSSLSCSRSDGDFCACTANAGVSNGDSCSPSTLAEPGACCAPPGYPGAGGVCTCASFTCDVNAGGGRDCWYHSGDTGHTTAATGAVCCLRLQGICSCYPPENAESCKGYPTVSSCTMGSVAPCTDITNDGDVAVAACR